MSVTEREVSATVEWTKRQETIARRDEPGVEQPYESEWRLRGVPVVIDDSVELHFGPDALYVTAPLETINRYCIRNNVGVDGNIEFYTTGAWMRMRATDTNGKRVRWWRDGGKWKRS